MVGKRRSVAVALALSAGVAVACGNGGGVPGGGDGGADAAADAIVGTTCVQYGNQADLRMAIAGAHDGYLNWRSEGVECDGSFADHQLTWEIPGLHTVTLIVPDMVAMFMADENSAQLQLLLSGSSYDTGPDGCTINLIENFEHDPDSYPGIYKVRGNGECAALAQPIPPATETVQVVGPFAFTGYVLTAD